MPVTITGLFRNPIRNVPYTSGTVEVAIGDAFGVGDIGYISNARSYKVTADGMNGSGGITLVVDDDAPSDVSFLFPDGVTTAVVSVDGADTSQTLEDLLTTGGDAPTGSTILIQGAVNDPQTNAPRIGMRIEIALVEMFATEDGVYLPVSKSFRMTEYGINNDDVDSAGVTLYVPTGVASQWRFDFYASYADDAPLLWSSTAYFDDSMGTVEIADVLDGAYATWAEPAPPPDAPTSLTLAATGASLDDVLISWVDNDDDPQETGYVIQYALEPTFASPTTLTTTAADATSYTHITPTLGEVTHYYRIRATNGNNSAWVTASISGLLLGLIAYWKMDETSGNRADSVGSNALVPAASLGSTTGKIGNAANVTDVGDNWMNAANNVFASDAAFTFALWINPSGTGGVASLGNLAFGLDFVPGDSAVLYYNSLSGNVQHSYTPSQWNNTVIRYDATTLSINVDDGTPATQAIALTAGTGLGLRVGGRHGDGSNITAAIDEAGYWNRALSAAEQTAWHNGGAGITYPFT